MDVKDETQIPKEWRSEPRFIGLPFTSVCFVRRIYQCVLRYADG
jgi:hypothetical protein